MLQRVDTTVRPFFLQACGEDTPGPSGGQKGRESTDRPGWERVGLILEGTSLCGCAPRLQACSPPSTWETLTPEDTETRLSEGFTRLRRQSPSLQAIQSYSLLENRILQILVKRSLLCSCAFLDDPHGAWVNQWVISKIWTPNFSLLFSGHFYLYIQNIEKLH